MASYLVPLLGAAIYIVVFSVVLAHRPWQREHRLLAAYLGTAALWSFSDFLLRGNIPAGHQLTLLRVVVWTSLWWVVQFYSFVRTFLHLPSGWGVRFGYISLVALGAAAVAGYAPPSATFSEGSVSPEYGWWFVLYFGPIATLGLFGVSSLARKLNGLSDSRERNKLAYLISAVGALVLFGSLGVSPLASKFPVSHIGGLLAACIMAYAVLKHELVSINSVLRRGLGWASLFMVGISAYVSLFYLLHLVFKFDLPSAVLIAATAASVASSLLVYRLRHPFLGMVDQLFYGRTYSYRRTLLGFNARMGNIINLTELAAEMLPTIANAVRASQVHLLFEDSSTGDFTTRFAYPKAQDKPGHEAGFDLGSPIVAWLEKDTGPLDIKEIDFIPQLKGLWQPERDRLASLDLEFLCPVKSRGKLIGILALGRKTSRAAYSQEDLDMIVGMASHAGIMIENARMFDTLSRQQAQIQQILAQSVVAQEEERQRISIDLHDSVAQWLAGASYRVQTADALLSGDGDPEVREELASVEETINRSLKELRRVVIGLRPPALDELGLDHALRRSLDELKADGLICKFNQTGKLARLSSSMEIAVYRLVQEALTNIRKHAGATKVTLRVLFRDDALEVEVRDNGRGFNLSETLDSAVAVGHMGLLGMKQRAEMLGGDIRIRTAEGAGTALTLTLPIHSREDTDSQEIG